MSGFASRMDWRSLFVSVPRPTRRGPAVERSQRWLETLMTLKRQKVLNDPQMFATYTVIVEDSRDVVQAHGSELVGQLAPIIERKQHCQW